VFSISALGQYVQTAAGPCDIAIIGDGTDEAGLGAILSMAGHKVRLFGEGNVLPSECEIRQRQNNVGQIRGNSKFAVVSPNIEAVVAGSACILLQSSATRYGELIRLIAPYLTNGQTLVLVNAPLGAAFQCLSELRMVRTDIQVNILEMGQLFDSMQVEHGVALAAGPRKRVSISGLSRNETRRGLAVARNLWMGLVPASNVLERGLLDAERLLRPALTLFAALGNNLSDANAVPPAILALLQGLDNEIQQISKAYKLVVPPFEQSLSEFCERSGSGFESQILEVCNKENGALSTEVGETLVLCEELARLARIPVPIIDSIIELSTVIVGEDLRKTARTLHDLGLVGFDFAEIIEIVNA
jgi:opine dehydrogenase